MKIAKFIIDSDGFSIHSIHSFINPLIVINSNIPLQNRFDFNTLKTDVKRGQHQWTNMVTTRPHRPSGLVG